MIIIFMIILVLMGYTMKSNLANSEKYIIFLPIELLLQIFAKLDKAEKIV